MNGNWKCCFNSKFNRFKRCNILATLWIISNIQSSNQCDIFKNFLYQSSGGNWESKCRTSNLLIPKFFHREDLDSLHCTTCSWLLWKRGNTFCKLMQILFAKNTNTFYKSIQICYCNLKKYLLQTNTNTFCKIIQTLSIIKQNFFALWDKYCKLIQILFFLIIQILSTHY